MSMEDYHIQFELHGVEPKCACGLCTLRPKFCRGKFMRFASFHNRFDVKEQLYVEKYGEPKCK